MKFEDFKYERPNIEKDREDIRYKRVRRSKGL